MEKAYFRFLTEKTYITNENLYKIPIAYSAIRGYDITNTFARMKQAVFPAGDMGRFGGRTYPG